MTRRNFPSKVKAAAFERANGKCEECGGKLAIGKFRYDHVLADALGGEPTLENCKVICANFPGSCDHAKTYGQDIPMIAKADRLKAKHIGTKKRKSRPIPGSRDSGWKHEMSGRWVRR